MEKYRKLIDQALVEHDKIYEDTTLSNEEKIKKFEELLSSTYPKIPQGEDLIYIRSFFEGVIGYGNKKTLEQADRLYRLHYRLGHLAHIIQEKLTKEDCWFASSRDSIFEYDGKKANKDIIWDFTYEKARFLDLSEDDTCLLCEAFVKAVEIARGAKYLQPKTLSRTIKTYCIIQDIFTNILRFAQGINMCKFKNIDDYFEKVMPENYYKIYKRAIEKSEEGNNDNATIEP